MKKKMDVGEGIIADNASWTFGSDTAKTFSGHVRRSVPFYDEGHDLVAKISDFFVKPGSVCYELGVSTGTLIDKLSRRHKPSVKWVGLDSEGEMVSRAKEEMRANGNKMKNVELAVEDVNLYEFQPADLIISYYTIQFIPPRLRQALIDKIYKALNWGGAFLIFEKVRAPDARFQDMMTAIYTDFKLEQKYSPEEIIAKSRSLKGVLEPFSTQGNLDLYKRAGFVDVMTVFKYVSFEGFLCVK
ncbi:MAG: methyltransferase domain-containing protein [Candidatus Omnitrophica bacterium]|nr:methyltransferase domain-containing protein [Candidatus Omnitrophota bacterium]